jgi:hypothetical protein
MIATESSRPWLGGSESGGRPGSWGAGTPSNEVTDMEMSWLETVRLIGLDLQAGVVVVLFALHAVERALASAWAAFRQRRPAKHGHYPEVLGAAKLGA